MAYDALRSLPPRFKTWEDVFAITNGLRGVPIEEIEAGQLVWPYDFTSKDMRHCGRDGCKQVHGYGWVVALRDGRFVHIGSDCAEKYANAVLWQAQINAHSERVRKEVQERSFAMARDQAQANLHWLDNDSHLPLAKKLYVSLVTELRGPLLENLRKRAEKGEAIVTKERRLSDEEIRSRRDAQTIIREDGSTFTPQISPFESVPLGRLRGINCFKDEIGELVRDLERSSSLLLQKSHGEMSKDEVKDMTLIARNAKNIKRKLERSVSDLSSFLEVENLRLLASSPLANQQGVLSIAVHNDNVVVVRKAHWGSRAA